MVACVEGQKNSPDKGARAENSQISHFIHRQLAAPQQKPLQKINASMWCTEAEVRVWSSERQVFEENKKKNQTKSLQNGGPMTYICPELTLFLLRRGQIDPFLVINSHKCLIPNVKVWNLNVNSYLYILHWISMQKSNQIYAMAIDCHIFMWIWTIIIYLDLYPPSLTIYGDHDQQVWK